MTSHHITSHHISSHYTTSDHITPHHVTSRHITSYQMTSQHITSHHISSHYTTSDHITSHHVTSHHIISDDITTHHITSYQLTLHHVRSHHTTSRHITSHHTSHITSQHFVRFVAKCVHKVTKLHFVFPLDSKRRIFCSQVKWHSRPTQCYNMPACLSDNLPNDFEGFIMWVKSVKLFVLILLNAVKCGLYSKIKRS